MSFPPRLGHLATRQVVVAKLTPTFAKAHEIDDEEGRERLERALAGTLWDKLLGATWVVLNDGKHKDEEALLEKVARTLKNRPMKPGKLTEEVSAALSAFMLMLDLEAGTAAESARRVMERPEAQAMAQKGLLEAGRLLAKELLKA